jgi:hypothetical protein
MDVISLLRDIAIIGFHTAFGVLLAVVMLIASSALAVHHPPGTDAVTYNPTPRGHEAPARMVYSLGLRNGELTMLPPPSWKQFDRPGVEWSP